MKSWIDSIWHGVWCAFGWNNDTITTVVTVLMKEEKKNIDTSSTIDNGYDNSNYVKNKPNLKITKTTTNKDIQKKTKNNLNENVMPQ